VGDLPPSLRAAKTRKRLYVEFGCTRIIRRIGDPTAVRGYGARVFHEWRLDDGDRSAVAGQWQSHQIASRFWVLLPVKDIFAILAPVQRVFIVWSVTQAFFCSASGGILPVKLKGPIL